MQMLAYTLDDAHNRHIHGIGRQFIMCYFFFQAEDGIRDADVTGVQTCALPISPQRPRGRHPAQPRDLRRGDRGRGGQPVQAAALHRRAAPRDDRRGDHQPRRGPAPAHRLVRRAPHRPRRPRARRLHRAWHPRRVGLRVRVPDGAHEPQAAVDRRDGVTHAGREVHVHLVEVDQGGRQLRNVCRRNGSTGRRKAAHRKISAEMTGGSERPPYPPVLADRLKTLAPSSTLAVQAKARELRARGIDVISFGAGGPDFDTPQRIKDAAVQAMRRGQTQYTVAGGSPELRGAVCAKLKRDNGLDYTPADVLVSCGAKHTLYNLVTALLNPGDEMLEPSPFWVSYPEQARLLGAVPVVVETREATGFDLDPDRLRAAVTSRTN